MLSDHMQDLQSVMARRSILYTECTGLVVIFGNIDYKHYRSINRHVTRQCWSFIWAELNFQDKNSPVSNSSFTKECMGGHNIGSR